MSGGVALLPIQANAPSSQKPLIDAAEIQKNFSKVSNFNLVFKGLNCFFGWVSYLPFSDGASSKIGSSRSIVKLCSSTMSIPKLANKALQLHHDIKALVCCVNSRGGDPQCGEKILNVISDVFFSSVGFLKRTSKVIFCLDKTQMIDLTMVSESVPDYLEKFCLVTTVIFAVKRIATSVLRLQDIYCSNFIQPEGLKEDQENEEKCLMLKIASSTLKLFSAALVTIVLFVPTVVISPVLLLGVSSLSFGLGLTGAFIKPGRFEAPFQKERVDRPIYYLKA